MEKVIEKLNLIEKDGKTVWSACSHPNGACEVYKGNPIICNNCKYRTIGPTSKKEKYEFLLDEERGKVIRAGACYGVNKWLFCECIEEDTYDWSGCSSEGGCCIRILWTKNVTKCYGCINYRHRILNHKGFKVHIDKRTGDIVWNKSLSFKLR